MFERTFMWKMFVKLCAGFWPENANTFLSILSFFLKWNIVVTVTASYGIGYNCWPDQYKKSKGWGLGARRLATHTHTQTLTLVSQAELLNESQKCGPRGGSCRPSPWLLAQGRWKREPRSILSNARCISSFPGLKFSWNAKTIKEWSVYIPARKPTLRLRWSMDSPYSVQTISKRWSFPGLFLPQLNSIARIRIWKDIHSKDVCQIMCLIWTWPCKNNFQAFWVIFLEWKKSWPWCFFGRKNPVLPCKSANSTEARFSKYPTQSIQRKAADGPYALEGWLHKQATYTNPQTELLSQSQKGGIRPKIHIT